MAEGRRRRPEGTTAKRRMGSSNPALIVWHAIPAEAQSMRLASRRIYSDVESLSTVPPHPGLVTRSLPLARPSRAFGFAQIPFAASQAAQVPWGEGTPLSRSQVVHQSVTQSSTGLFNVWFDGLGLNCILPFSIESFRLQRVACLAFCCHSLTKRALQILLSNDSMIESAYPSRFDRRLPKSCGCASFHENREKRFCSPPYRHKGNPYGTCCRAAISNQARPQLLRIVASLNLLVCKQHW